MSNAEFKEELLKFASQLDSLVETMKETHIEPTIIKEAAVVRTAPDFGVVSERPGASGNALLDFLLS
jgi:hypothetical protein